MKTFITALTVTMLMGTAAVAQKFNDTTVGVVVISGPLDFALDANKNGLTELEVGFTILAHQYGTVDADVRLSLGTDLNAGNNVFLRGEYNFAGPLTTELSAYGTFAAQYNTSSKLSNGTWYIDPSLGVSYAVTDSVSLFGEVGYTWDASNSMASVGGYAEIGLPVRVNETVTITPSIVRTFDTGNDNTNLHLGATFRF